MIEPTSSQLTAIVFPQATRHDTKRYHEAVSYYRAMWPLSRSVPALAPLYGHRYKDAVVVDWDLFTEQERHWWHQMFLCRLEPGAAQRIVHYRTNPQEPTPAQLAYLASEKVLTRHEAMEKIPCRMDPAYYADLIAELQQPAIVQEPCPRHALDTYKLEGLLLDLYEGAADTGYMEGRGFPREGGYKTRSVLLTQKAILELVKCGCPRT